MLVSAGVVPDLPTAHWGPELAALNPVRVEVVASAVLAWMGGKRGYALVPDGGGCPAVPGAMMSGSKYAGVYTLDR